jgi:hypothetical protein
MLARFLLSLGKHVKSHYEEREESRQSVANSLSHSFAKNDDPSAIPIAVSTLLGCGCYLYRKPVNILKIQ